MHADISNTLPKPYLPTAHTPTPSEGGLQLTEERCYGLNEQAVPRRLVCSNLHWLVVPSQEAGQLLQKTVKLTDAHLQGWALRVAAWAQFLSRFLLLDQPV